MEFTLQAIRDEMVKLGSQTTAELGGNIVLTIRETDLILLPEVQSGAPGIPAGISLTDMQAENLSELLMDKNKDYFDPKGYNSSEGNMWKRSASHFPPSRFPLGAAFLF